MNEYQRYENKVKRAQRILEIVADLAKQQCSCYVENIISNIQLHYNGYAGDEDNILIATGDWNEITYYDSITNINIVISNLPARVGDLFEKMGIEVEWEDEWTECCECRRLIRTEPNSYFWSPQFKYFEDRGYVCHSCLLEDPKEYLYCLEGNLDESNTFNEIDPADYGYVKFNSGSYCFGYSGTDDINAIVEYMKYQGVNKYLFSLDSQGQFTHEHSVYIHEDEIHLFQEDPDADEPDEYMQELTEKVMKHGLSDEIDKIVNSQFMTTCQSSFGAFTLQNLKDAIRKVHESIADTRFSGGDDKKEVVSRVVNCDVCGRENDQGVVECWWCGNNPDKDKRWIIQILI